MTELQSGVAGEGRLQQCQDLQRFCYRRKHFLLVITGAIFALLIAVYLLVWYQYLSRPEPEVYFTTAFAEGLEGWTAVDARWEEQTVMLARREYAAPYLMLPLSTAQSPPEDFTWYLPVKVSRFTNEAMVLGAVFLPHGPVAVVLSEGGRLGIARNLFASPEYSTAPLAYLYPDQWADVYVYVNSKEKQIELYLNSRLVLTTAMVESTFPVMEVWLGALWLGGAGNYGAPLNVTYKEVTFGNVGLLPQPSFWEFLRNLALDLWSGINRVQGK